MTAREQDLEFHRGEVVDIDFAVKTGEAATNLTDSVITYALGFYNGKPARIKKDSSGAEVTITDAEGGLVTVTLTEAETLDLAVATYWHKLIVTDSSGNPSVVATGTVVVRDNLAAY
jgi:hypothetical protein